ncbi:MAG: DUF2764 family protein [Rhabdochlamydiaceae bacterium]
MNHYFLVTYLPHLNTACPLETSSRELFELLETNLPLSDLIKIRDVRMLIDVENIYRYIDGLPIDNRGLLSSLAALEEALTKQDFFPDMVFDFLKKYPSFSDRKAHFEELVFSVLDMFLNVHKGVLRRYFLFKKDLYTHLKKLRSPGFWDKIEKNDSLSDFESSLTTLIQKLPISPKQTVNQLVELYFVEYENWSSSKHFSFDYLVTYVFKLMLLEDYSCRNEKQKLELETIR